MKYVTKAQIAFGQRLGLDLAGKSVGEARAMIDDAIQRDFLLDHDLGSPSPKQVELAAKFQRDISGASRRVGNAIINDLMTDLNHEAIKREGLAPVINKHDTLKMKRVISSILQTVDDSSTARKDLEQIAIRRFGVPRGSMRSFSNRQMLVEKLKSLIRNEQAHETISWVARRQDPRIR